MLTPDLHGQAFQQALDEQPQLTLNFYRFGVILRQSDGAITREYPVDPDQIAAVLATRTRFDSGLLTDDILLVQLNGVRQTVVGYRKPQRTGIYLEGAADVLRIPLPGMVMIRHSSPDRDPTLTVYAVKRRPKTLDATLYHVPLPNVFRSAQVCWGTVPRIDPETGISLAADWQRLLGSPFGNHAVHGKSVAYPDDVRDQLHALAKKQAKRYPTSDLVPTGRTLADVLAVQS